MTSPNRYQEAMRAWRDAAVPSTESEAPSNRDAKAVAALQDAIRAIPSRSLSKQRRHRTFAVLFAAAALVSLVVGVRHFRLPASNRIASAQHAEATLRSTSSTALIIRNGATRFVEPGTLASIQLGDEVSVAPGGQAELKLPSGAIVAVASTTRIRIGDLSRDETVDLVRGSVSLSVPKLQPPHTLAVVTPNASVVVHGTRFSVSVADSAPAATTETSVAVTEGEVAVVVPTGHIILRAGQSWRSSEATTKFSASSAAQGSPEVSPRADSTTKRARPSASTSPVSPAAEAKATAAEAKATMEALAEQNRLYRAAVAARRNGDEKAAVTLLTELLDRFPQSPLAAEARSERERASSRLTSGASR